MARNDVSSQLTASAHYATNRALADLIQTDILDRMNKRRLRDRIILLEAIVRLRRGAGEQEQK